MADWLFVSSDINSGTDAGGTTYQIINGFQQGGVTGTETETQTKVRDTYTAKNLWVNVSANTLASSSTVRTRKNTANGAQSVSIGSATTGTFEDTSNTDSLSTGDLFNLQKVLAGAGSITFRAYSVILNHASNTVPWLAGSTNNASYTADQYSMSFGVGRGLASVAEASRQVTIRTAITLSQMRVWIKANTATAATIKSRINGADGAMSVSITSGATGEFVDTTNSDSISVGDEVNTFVDITSGASLQVTVLEYEADGVLRLGVSGNANTISNTSYAYLCGRLGNNIIATESLVQVKARTTNPFKNLFAYISANATTATSTIGLRQNGSTAISVSIGSAATGIFEETSTTVTPATTDLLNYIISAGSAHNLTVETISIEQIPVAASSAIKTFDGLVYASTKTVNGLAIASVKTVNGLTNV